jgi:hypothetical protein
VAEASKWRHWKWRCQGWAEGAHCEFRRVQLGRTPLITAVFWGFGAVVHELMAAGADVNAADKVAHRPSL